MSNRRKNEGGGAKQNPSTRYLKWASNDKTLSFYNKEAGENQTVKLPYNFVILAERHAVGGWDDKNGCNIYSNEVKYIGQEQLTVKSTKGGVIASGIYKENKLKIVESGGRYQKSVYVFNLETKAVEKISLKGTAVQGFGDFLNEIKNKKLDYVISLVGSEDLKKGATKYSKPVFKLGDVISDELEGWVEKAYDEVDAYFGTQDSKEEAPDDIIEDDEPVDDPSSNDGLPF